MQKLHFVVTYKNKGDRDAGKPVASFDEEKQILKFAARMGNDKQGMIMDVVMFKADELTAAMIADNQAFEARGYLKTNPRDSDGNTYVNPQFVMINSESDSPLVPVEKLSKDTPNTLDVFCNFVSDENSAGWRNYILAAPAGKNQEGSYESTRIDASAKGLNLEKGKRYLVEASPYVDSYTTDGKTRQKLKAKLWRFEEYKAPETA